MANKNRTPEYAAWEHIVQRCTNPKCKAWKNYGARGITICGEWRNSFEAFFARVGVRPSPKHSIDRYPDNDGNYEPGNVRWATIQEQSRNRRSNRLITFNGETKCLKDWARSFGVSYQSLQRRLRKNVPFDKNNYTAMRTHCPRGHAYDKSNTFVGKRGDRRCRACARQQRERNKDRYNANARAARAARR